MNVDTNNWIKCSLLGFWPNGKLSI